MSDSTVTEIDALARQNIRAQRARLGLTQARVARRMNQLGFGWHQQTAYLVERKNRPLLASELAGLALALETTPDVLALPPPGMASVQFGDQRIPAQRLSIVDDSVSWDGDMISVAPPTVLYRPGDLRAVVDAVRAELQRPAEERATSQESGDAEDIPPRRPGRNKGRR